MTYTISFWKQIILPQICVQFNRWQYTDDQISQQPVGQIPWGHNITLLQKLNAVEERIWYAQKTIENGWSRSVLLHWIESNLHKRQGKVIDALYISYHFMIGSVSEY